MVNRKLRELKIRLEMSELWVMSGCKEIILILISQRFILGISQFTGSPGDFNVHSGLRTTGPKYLLINYSLKTVKSGGARGELG